jgi:hypothetical protein
VKVHGSVLHARLWVGLRLQLERVAVDTHGVTHFGMALTKSVSFDLCPRLARLCLPNGLDVPPILRPIVAETVSRRATGTTGARAKAPIVALEHDPIDLAQSAGRIVL